MTLAEQEAILTIALFAAFADGQKADTEREEIRRIAQSLADSSGSANLPRLVQDVLLRRVQLASATGVLTDAGQRSLALPPSYLPCAQRNPTKAILRATTPFCPSTLKPGLFLFGFTLMPLCLMMSVALASRLMRSAPQNWTRLSSSSMLSLALYPTQ